MDSRIGTTAVDPTALLVWSTTVGEYGPLNPDAPHYRRARATSAQDATATVARQTRAGGGVCA